MAGDHVVIAVADRARLQATRGRARARLGIALQPTLLFPGAMECSLGMKGKKASKKNGRVKGFEPSTPTPEGPSQPS